MQIEIVTLEPCLDILGAVSRLFPLAVNTSVLMGTILKYHLRHTHTPNPIYSILCAVLDVTKTQMFNNMCF